MNRQQMMGLALFGLVMNSTALLAQPAPNPPPNQVNDPTGTPPGVGFARKPPIFLKPGDDVAVQIAGVGELRNRCGAGKG